MKKLLNRIFKNKIFYLVLLIIVVIFFVNKRIVDKRKSGELVTFVVKKQDLLISVIEGGNLVALESQKIRNEVPGNRTILDVIDEGTEITEQDIANGRILISLDSKDLEDRKEQLTLNVENTLAAYTEAGQNLEIQKKQNDNDISQAELKVKFAEMDLDKYLGAILSKSILDKSEDINYAVLIRSDNLGGEALNKKSSLENKIDLAKEEVVRARDKVEWSQKLSEKGYVTKMELEADRLALKQKEVAQQQAELEYQLFLKYDFVKAVETYMSNYKVAMNQFERTKDTARARMIQIEANLRNRKSAYIQTRGNLRDVEQNIENCTIRATKQGFVTYATSSRPWASQSPIQPGTSIRMYQELFNLPDFRSMGVEVKIHESSIKKVQTGMLANIRVDAFPDVPLTGTVKKVAIMPDAAIKFQNPDINIYLTQITLNNLSDNMEFLKPGMTAKVEILIKELKDVVAVPINAVYFKGNSSFLSVLKEGHIIEKEVELGDSSETLVEIKEGLKEGETVIIKPGVSLTSKIKKAELEEKGVFKTDTSSQESVPAQTEPEREVERPSLNSQPANVVPDSDNSAPVQRTGSGRRRRPAMERE
ncbi:HlyD family efflux transporter periplasmic adaptor subunit [bacterium]|nr:HlyD family efflux transporter periplasmic adaptor subunit [bacterium]